MNCCVKVILLLTDFHINVHYVFEYVVKIYRICASHINRTQITNYRVIKKIAILSCAFCFFPSFGAMLGMDLFLIGIDHLTVGNL